MNIKNHVAIFSIWSHLVFSLKTCFRGSTIQKVWGNYETDEPIGTKFGTRLRSNLGIDICRQTMLPLEIPGGYLGFLGGQKYKSLGNLPNGWTNWHQIWYMSANSSGNGHRLNKISPSRSHEGIFCSFKGSNIKRLGKMAKRLDQLGPNCGPYIQMAL